MIVFCLDNQQMIDQDRRNNLQLKEDLLTKDACLFQAQSTIAGLRKDLEQTREEVRFMTENNKVMSRISR